MIHKPDCNQITGEACLCGTGLHGYMWRGVNKYEPTPQGISIDTPRDHGSSENPHGFHVRIRRYSRLGELN